MQKDRLQHPFIMKDLEKLEMERLELHLVNDKLIAIMQKWRKTLNSPTNIINKMPIPLIPIKYSACSLSYNTKKEVK